MYAVITVCYKFGEMKVDLVSESSIRNYCLKKINEYAKDIINNFENENEDDHNDEYENDGNKNDDVLDEELIKYISNIRKNIMSELTRGDRSSNNIYTLEQLIDIFLCLGNIMIENQIGHGVNQIIKGSNMSFVR